MILVFTGTREGLTKRQRDTLKILLPRLAPECSFHGGCLGADEEFHYIVLSTLITPIEIFPSDIPKYRAEFPMDGVRKIHEPKPPLDRNKLMVDKGDFLVAAPKAKEELRSGTWATVRHARRTFKPGVILDP